MKTVQLSAPCGFVASTLAAIVLSVAAQSEPDFAILPSSLALTHKGALHSLIIEETMDGRFVSDRTASARFESSDPMVAEVDAKGIVRAVGNGESTITATVNGQSVTAKVTVTGADAPYVPSFRNDVQPLLFKMGCNTGACHGAQAGKNGFKLSLRGFDDEWDYKVLTRQANGRRLSLSEPEESLVLLKATLGVPHGGGARFTADSEAYRILLDWIRAGAPGARDDEASVERIDVLPKLVIAQSGARQRVIVQAQYSDGSVRDVTRWARFDTTDDSVAVVDDLGNVAVVGPGAAAVTVYFASKVSTVRVMAPRDAPVPDALYAQAESNNYIDELILRQLKNLGIAPAALCTDTEFIRRATLDAIGVLPTPDEVSRFVLDTDPDKRTRWIESLLNRPEYVDYWSYKWSDLLLLSSKNLPRREELNSFYRYIRESVEANKPWDRFVREIVTADGSTLENGAANYFAMHKETVDLTETTSQAFLGFSITCARCHNHPLEKWTQDDYYGMANLFSRVRFKNGIRGVGTDVLADTFGDIIHPRLGRPVPPRPLDAEPIGIHDAGDRRVALARWLTSPENPYFTRAIVNRVWRNFMGVGLVEPEDDLRLTNPPSNEELLDALARDLVDHEYDLKYLMRTIMGSAAYQRSSQPPDPSAPDGKHYSHYIVRRLSAEVILDAYSQVTGVPTKFDGYPAGYRALQLPDSQVGSYFLSAFGRPQRTQVCSCERTEDSNVAQTLHVANGETLNGKLRDAASFIAELIHRGVTDDAALDMIYIRALARTPTPQERAEALAVLADVPTDGPEAKAERRAALEDVAWAVLSGKEFLFNH